MHELELQKEKIKRKANEMSATVYKWIVVYEDGRTEERRGEAPWSFADELDETPVAIIRNGW